MRISSFSLPEVKTKDVIGQLDRTLSELLWLVENPILDQIDAQTLKHHAEDMIGAGNKMLEILEARK